MRGARRAAALFVLAGFFAPAASAALAVLHLSTHHPAEAHEEHDEHAADLSVLWHGHGHEATTPAHDHPLLVARIQAFRIPAAGQVRQCTPGLWQPAVLALAAAPRVWRLRPPGLAGLGPPALPGRLSILRV